MNSFATRIEASMTEAGHTKASNGTGNVVSGGTAGTEDEQLRRVLDISAQEARGTTSRMNVNNVNNYNFGDRRKRRRKGGRFIVFETSSYLKQAPSISCGKRT